jgi:hypothetical protein
MVIKLIADIRGPDGEGKYPLKISFANFGKTALAVLQG